MAGAVVYLEATATKSEKLISNESSIVDSQALVAKYEAVEDTCRCGETDVSLEPPSDVWKVPRSPFWSW